MTKQQSKRKNLPSNAVGGGELAKKTLPPKVQSLLAQQKYRQALEEIKKIKRSSPDLELAPTEEASIWSLRGQQEFKQDRVKAAMSSFRQALELGLDGEAHYWIAKCLLALNRLDEALKLFADAFEHQRLRQEYTGCYLKLLLLKGDTDTIDQLLSQSAQQFSAAQKHWARGAITLRVGQPEVALSHFQKVKSPVTPDDVPSAWIAYTQQVLSDWQAAAITLETKRSQITHPAVKRLRVLQHTKTGQSIQNIFNQRPPNGTVYQEAILISETLHLIDQGNLHEAGHAFLELNRRSTHFPQLATLYCPLLTLAGQQALDERELDCAETFWQPLLGEQPFNYQLAVNLLPVLNENDSHKERQRLLTRLAKWLESEAQQNPQMWPDSRLKPTLAKIHCLLADSWMALRQPRTAVGAVRQAERIEPESAEVFGRRGLIAYSDDNYEEATELLTQALEKGCRYEEVYGALLKCWQELEDQQSFKETRRRFGKHFGDVMVESDVEIAPWIEALSTQSYPFFMRLIEEYSEDEPALEACQIFIDATGNELTSSGRVPFSPELAKPQWLALLAQLSPLEQIPVLQAIIVSLQLFAKRQKGLSALINEYIQQLYLLTDREPAAAEAHLVMLAVKGSSPKQIQPPLRRYLDGKTQPGTALANLQLQVHHFSQSDTLVSFIDEALGKEPQNPHLLLAKATTYPTDSENYENLYRQGFELARRLQDAKALQAFREEQAFLKMREAQELLPSFDRLDSFAPPDIDEFLENLIRKMMGGTIPPDELRRLMPQLKQKLLEDMPDFDDDDDDFDPEPIRFAFPFDLPSSGSKKSKRKRR
ncbi:MULTISPECIES: tetratricopeptide repeat protein [unclassified Coleofasciculus]|uniref:tetratricopeptide repeat protein n=1 Tax=unclassified Coleofasciculus TaxID=2692782 RepID=UPI00187F04B3|nr:MULTISPECIES: tetratricopeptide repeat protein [unclassified Coleofasciculus]MBE9128672.1 tetratricopeptide repeat protein [Coleofasciculus sp. LEGE 07081]MBE9147158.1 tetratricopeptide repeat protein [Coleofasciculus sp. LEGE 07092]